MGTIRESRVVRVPRDVLVELKLALRPEERFVDDDLGGLALWTLETRLVFLAHESEDGRFRAAPAYDGLTVCCRVCGLQLAPPVEVRGSPTEQVVVVRCSRGHDNLAQFWRRQAVTG